MNNPIPSWDALLGDQAIEPGYKAVLLLGDNMWDLAEWRRVLHETRTDPTGGRLTGVALSVRAHADVPLFEGVLGLLPEHELGDPLVVVVVDEVQAFEAVYPVLLDHPDRFLIASHRADVLVEAHYTHRTALLLGGWNPWPAHKVNRCDPAHTVNRRNPTPTSVGLTGGPLHRGLVARRSGRPGIAWGALSGSELDRSLLHDDIRVFATPDPARTLSRQDAYRQFRGDLRRP